MVTNGIINGRPNKNCSLYCLHVNALFSHPRQQLPVYNTKQTLRLNLNIFFFKTNLQRTSPTSDTLFIRTMTAQNLSPNECDSWPGGSQNIQRLRDDLSPNFQLNFYRGTVALRLEPIWALVKPSFQVSSGRAELFYHPTKKKKKMLRTYSFFKLLRIHSLSTKIDDRISEEKNVIKIV